MKPVLVLGAVAGIVAATAALIYQKVYANALGYDFAAVVKPGNVFITCIGATLLAGVAYYLLTKWKRRTGEVIFNFLLMILTFASILGPFATKLPLEVEMPELFPGLTVPMHFFPALAWFTLKPLFIGK